MELFKDYLHQTNFNTEPVLITYPDSVEINTFIALRKQSKPVYEYSTTNKENIHFGKSTPKSEVDWLQEHFENIPNLYIADGHHRSASAELLYEQDKHLGNENLNYFMSFLIAESNVKIYEFNRLIRDLNGLSKDTLLKIIRTFRNCRQKSRNLETPK